MSRLSLGGTPALPSVEVDLWDRTYVARAMTRALTLEVEQLERKVREARSSDAGVEALADLIDAVLEPTGGQRKSAKALIVEKWKANELSVQQLVDFSDQLQGRADPPT
jgi:hypothetical protein